MKGQFKIMRIQKTLNKSIAFLSSVAFSISLTFNVGAVKPHADPQTPEEVSILGRIYNLPGYDTPIPNEEFLPALNAMRQELNHINFCDGGYEATEDLLNRLIDNIVYRRLFGFVPTMTGDEFSAKAKEIYEIYYRYLTEYTKEDKGEFCPPNLGKNFESLLTQAFGFQLCTLPTFYAPRVDDSSLERLKRSKELFQRLVKLYIDRIDKAGRPRVLILGSGRYIPRESYIHSVRSASFNNTRLPWANVTFKFHNTSQDFDSKDSYDAHYYGDSRWDYLLLNIDFSVQPDICINIFDPNAIEVLGENQWDYIINEHVSHPDDTYRELKPVAERLLKPGGKLLCADKKFLSHEKFDPSEDHLGDATIVYKKA